MVSTQGSITVSPGIPGYAAARAKQLGLPTRSAYLAILLNNYLYGPPMALPMVESPERVVKVRIQLSIPLSLRSASSKSAARWKMSLSELVEALVIKDEESEVQTLIIWPARGAEKPSFKELR